MPHDKHDRPPKVTEYRCVPCHGAAFETFGLLSKHLTKKHPHPERYTCDTCGEHHRAMDHLQQHLDENVTHMRTRRAAGRNKAQQDNGRDPQDTDEEQEGEDGEDGDEEPQEETEKRRTARENTLRRASGKYCPPEVVARAESGRSNSLLLENWICRLCFIVFPDSNALTRHLWYHTDHTQTPGTQYQRCQTCSQRMRSFKAFRNHLGREPSHMRILLRGPSDSHHPEPSMDGKDEGETTPNDLDAEEDSAGDMEEESEAEEDVADDGDEKTDTSSSGLSDGDGDMEVDGEIPNPESTEANQHKGCPTTFIDGDLQDQCNSSEKWYPGKLSRPPQPKVILTGMEDSTWTTSSCPPSTTHALTIPAKPRFPSLRPVNLSLGASTPPTQTAINGGETGQRPGPPNHEPVNAIKQEDNSSDDSDTTDESESEEEIIELGENPDVDDATNSMDIVSEESIPVVKQIPITRQRVTRGQECREEEDSEEESSEDDSSADDSDSEDNATKIAKVSKEREPVSDDATSVRPRRPVEGTRDTSSTTSTSSVRVKLEDTEVPGFHSTTPKLCTIALQEEESERVPADRESVKVEQNALVSNQTKSQLHGSRDRIASFNSHYACSHCDRTFNTPDTLLSHLRAVDKNVKWYNCSSCNRGFATPEPFKAHLAEYNTHMRVGSVEVAPPSTSVGVQGQAQHMQQRQSEGHGSLDRRQKSYCSTCDQTYKSIDHLIKHRRRYHKSAPYKCMTCSKDFPAGINLKYHLLEHTDHMQVVQEAVVPATVDSRAASAMAKSPGTKPKEGTASVVIELSSDSDSDVALGLKSRKTMLIGGKAKIRVSKVRISHCASSTCCLGFPLVPPSGCCQTMGVLKCRQARKPRCLPVEQLEASSRVIVVTDSKQ